MPDPEVPRSPAPPGLPIAPSLGPTLERMGLPPVARTNGKRLLGVCAVAMFIAVLAGLVAQGLTRLIGLITNIAFYGRVSTAFSSPAGNHRGLWVLVIPVLGGIVVGFMARYGSKAIRGHGIPEAMEQVLFNRSRIPARMTFLKPLSAAIAIGTGGPFGAEGPIIATGGALGSLAGQLLPMTADERKTLLAAGAAAGMAATFGSPVSAVLLAVELLLFEYRPRSIVPVALATSTATGLRMAFSGSAPVFAMPNLLQPSGGALAAYIVLGGLVGIVSIGVTRAVYAVEDAFEKLPFHWMGWPALGAVAVGVLGVVSPRTLGVGYDNIDRILSGDWLGPALWLFCLFKFISWAVALGSGTSGGTLAPLFTLGGGLGSALGALAVAVAPQLGVDVRMAALVGMAALFAGASRALLTSVVFAFETTRQPMGLLPLLGGCAAAYLVSYVAMRNTIMTEKLARRGSRIPSDYSADYLGQMLVRDHATEPVVSLRGTQTLHEVKAWMLSRTEGVHHQGFPVLSPEGNVQGVLTRRDLLDENARDTQTLQGLVKRAPVVIYEESSLREAADHMVREDVGRLVVVRSDAPRTLRGILTRSDILKAHRRRLDDASALDARLSPTFFLRPTKGPKADA